MGSTGSFAILKRMKSPKRSAPSLLFAADACGKAEEAILFYERIFPGSAAGYINHYQPGEAGDPRAKTNYAELTLLGFQLVAMDHGVGGDEPFNEAFSFMVLCETQDEIDRYWDALSAVPEAEQCGWLKDKFGLSWQIVPAQMSEMPRLRNARGGAENHRGFPADEEARYPRAGSSAFGSQIGQSGV